MDFMMKLKDSFCMVVDVAGNKTEDVVVEQSWEGNRCKSVIKNRSNGPICLSHIVLFQGEHGMSRGANQYGEGYQKLSHYEGCIGNMTCVGGYTDAGHYKLPSLQGYQTMYNMTYILEEGWYTLLGFSSCHRFVGKLHFNDLSYKITQDMEGIRINGGETIELEEFACLEGNDREELLESFADLVVSHHPPLRLKGEMKVPTGWCSWYCYGPNINEEIIRENLERIRALNLNLEYIQIDDGYQPKMGDWLEPNKDFGMNTKELCLGIKEQGFQPAIWVAPFIAEESSKVFIEHPDWFIQDGDGKPLCSNTISFGGWRRGPWYMLDGTHPEAQNYLRLVFQTMREEWECTYFKLDANVWGALPGGHYYDEQATCTEAYRRGMAACIDGAGEDSFILGCNAPMWSSIGVVHGMRLTDDISREWDSIYKLYRECFHRNWQHMKFWVNDPDCIVLENLSVDTVDVAGFHNGMKTHVTDHEFDFHKTYILASGGMVLGSDIMNQMSEESVNILRKLLPSIGKPAKFGDMNFRVGYIDDGSSRVYTIFNPSDHQEVHKVEWEDTADVVDFWTDEELTKDVTSYEVTLAPRSAVAIRIKR